MGKSSYHISKYCVSDDFTATVCDSELISFKDKIKNTTCSVFIVTHLLIKPVGSYFWFLNESTREGHI